MSDLMRAAPLLMWCLLLLALLMSRSIGMTIGALVMLLGAFTHNALFVSLGALWSYAMMPDKDKRSRWRR